ncbi:MAG: hypothetical protein JO369_02150 [Paucibacter sp.]|nr:hypothetical protein [Roseateles sp.]
MTQPPTLPPAPPAANEPGQEAKDALWADIVRQLGAEIAGPLSAALERIHGLISTGQIDRQGLRALRESVAAAREAGMVGQQLGRLASGRLNITRERLHLTQLMRNVLAHRSRETQARGIQVRQQFKPVEVMADASLLFSLLNAMMDWALGSTHSSIDLRIDLTPWPTRARLSCRFAHRALELLDSGRTHNEALPSTDTLAWRLVEQTALAMGLQPVRENEAGITVLTLEFAFAASEDAAESSAGDLPAAGRSTTAATIDDLPEYPPSANSKPLAGSHVLIVSPRIELRRQIQAAVAHMGLIVDVVDTVADAVQFCAEGLPHGVLFEASLSDEVLGSLQPEVAVEVPDFCWVEVHDEERVTQLSTATPDGVARIARAHLTDALPSLLTFELSKSH